MDPSGGNQEQLSDFMWWNAGTQGPMLPATDGIPLRVYLVAGKKDDGREKDRAVRQESRKENQKFELTVAASQENGVVHQASERGETRP